jgi:hypothetical protein
MASKTDIANLAISHHSGGWVTDIDSAPGATAEAIRAVWDAELEEAMAAHPWKFARKSWRDQAALPDASNPDPDMRFAFLKPADCVRVFEIRPKLDFDEWENIITTDAGNIVTLIGTRRGVDIGRHSAFFNVYLAAKIALRICISINASEAIRERCRKDMEIAFTKAASDNGRAGKVKRVAPDSFIAARFVRGNGSFR